MSAASRLHTVVGAAGVVCALAVGPGCKNSSPKPPLRVAAAADLTFAFNDLGAAFEKETGQQVTFSFGSTGLLSKQVIEGAPFEVFAGADISFVNDTVRSGACFADTEALYATGRIVIWWRGDAAFHPQALDDLVRPEITKIAIANPDHAPYGRAAKQALTHAGLWEKVTPKVVYGENVQQTLQFAQSGNAEVAIVALSLATASGGAFTLIDPASHERLDQALVVCRGAGTLGQPSASARQFVAFVNSNDGRAIMRRFGFLLPGESLASH